MEHTGWLKNELLSSVEEYILDVRKALPSDSKTAQAIDHGYSWSTLARIAAAEGHLGFAEEVQAAALEQNPSVPFFHISAEPRAYGRHP